MPEPIAYLNRQLIPAAQAAVSVFDAGFIFGATVTEVLRTFRGEIFRLPEHLERLRHSLAIVRLEPSESLTDIAEIAGRVVAHNYGLIDPANDLALTIFITPGPSASAIEESAAVPLVGVHTRPLQFEAWADRYERGQALVTTSIRQVPSACWSPELKCRSRMHYFLADREARRIDPAARAVLLDSDGHVTEATTANVLLFDAMRLLSPPIADVLPGISLQVIKELASRLDIPFTHRKIHPDELAQATEAFLTSTPNCILPVTRFNGQPIGDGKPGEIFRFLLSAWNEMVGFDVAQQARRFAL